MNNYEVTFTVNGTKSVQVVSAGSSTDAKKLIQSQYGGSKVNIHKVITVRK